MNTKRCLDRLTIQTPEMKIATEGLQNFLIWHLLHLSLVLSCLSTHAFMNNPALSGAWANESTKQAYMGSRRLMCQAQGQDGSVSGPPHMWWLLAWCFVGCLTVETGVFLALLGNLSTLFLLLGCSIQSQ